MMRIQDPIASQTLMKSNAQLRLRYLQEPHPFRLLLLLILLAALSSMQGDISSIQWEVRSINTRVEQCQIDIQECFKHHHPDED
jgi:hypothetical protein